MAPVDRDPALETHDRCRQFRSGGVPRDLVFISYSRQDQVWLDPLSQFLGPLRVRGLQI